MMRRSGADHRNGRRSGTHARLTAATAVMLAAAASPSLAQSITAEGAVSPVPPSGGPWIEENVWIGDGGEGTVTASGGATIQAKTTVVGNGPDGVGTVILSDIDTTLDSSFALYIGDRGAGEFQILDGAKASAGAMVVLGFGAGSTGSLIVSGDGAKFEGDPGAASPPLLWIGQMFGHGQMTVDRGGVVQTGIAYIDNGSATVDGSGSRWETTFLNIVDDNSSLTVTDGGHVHATSLIVGDTGQASATIDGLGSRLEVDGDLLVGAEAGSEGLLTLSSGAVASAGGFVSIGEKGFGSIAIESGSTLSSDSGYLGFEGQGAALIMGAGSRWDSTFFVLGTYGDSTGSLIVSHGGVASASHAGGFRLGFEDQSAGTIAVGAALGDDAQVAGLIEGVRLEIGETSSLVFNHTGLPDGTDLRFAPDLFGSGSIFHENGITRLDGDGSAFSGLTTVSGGRLIVLNGLGGSVRVGNGGFLGGVSTIGSGIGSVVTIGNGGTLGPGDPIGRINIDGNLVFDAGSTFEVGLLASQPSDVATVTGTVDAAGGRVRVVTLDPETSYSNGATYRILDTTGGFLSEFGGVDSQSAFLQFAIDHKDTGLDLIVRMAGGSIDFTDAARTPNQRSTAEALNGLAQAGPSLALYNAVAMLGEGDARNAFDQLSGEIHASQHTALISDSRHLRNAINDRIRAAFSDDVSSDLPILAYAQNAATPASASSHQASAVWATAYGSQGAIDSDGNAALTGHGSGGVLFGIDAPVSDDWRLGFVSGYSRSWTDLDARASSASSDSYHVGLYAGSAWNDMLLRSGLSASWHDIETRRSVGFAGFADSLAADYRARTVQAFGELATTLRTRDWTFEPYANASYMVFDADGFSESGGAAALASAGGSSDAAIATLGVRAEHQVALGSADARLTGMLGWQHAWGDTVPTSSVAFATSDVFAVAGAIQPRNSAVVEAGLEVGLSASALIGFSYRGMHSAETHMHSFETRASIRF